MKLQFLGTRGEIELRSRYHFRHSALLVGYRGRRVMVDCGQDWSDAVWQIAPQAIVLTHAHPDHAWGLKSGAPCPVVATAKSWKQIGDYPIRHRITIGTRRSMDVQGITFEAFAVEHSLLSPAVAYRITAGSVAVFYAPDLVSIVQRRAALAGVRLYIGDGASLTRPIVRPRGAHLIGHAPVRTQLGWLQQEKVPRAIFTHCGSQVVANHRAAATAIRRMARERNVDAALAHDGMQLVLR